MILHANAALSRRQRERLVSLVFAGTTITAAALVAGCSRQTASKWVGRARRGEGLADRSSRPRRSPRGTPVLVEQAVLRARRELRLGPHPLGWAPRPRRLDRARDPQAQRLLTAARAARPRRDRPLRARAPRRARPRRCQKLGRIVKPSHRVTGDRRDRSRGAGWQYVFVAIDDTTRLGFARIFPDESADSALAFLDQLERFYARHAIRGERVLTDNGTCFKRRWAEACQRRGIKPKKTRLYRPQTNGKAERFIRTLLELWAYACPYEHERSSALAPALDSYNRSRRHRALEGLTPLQGVNNLSGTNS